jgi:hypothetical protein
MELIIAGATGYVGSTVLAHCVADPSISKIFVLSRRALTEYEGLPPGESKVEVILQENWLHYRPELLKKLTGTRGCLW